MPKEFWDEAPVCGALKMTRGGRLVKGSAVSDGLMGGLTGGTDVPDVLIGVFVEDGLDVMFE